MRKEVPVFKVSYLVCFSWAGFYAFSDIHKSSDGIFKYVALAMEACTYLY